ncbi:conserved hypothetical protein [Flavobacterium sp. 9AF]|nr:conserved hypothetical protein [Flavobacterium sp. 9AF]
MDGLQLKLNQGLVETTKKVDQKITEETATKNISLHLKEINLTNINVIYKDEISLLDTQISFQKFNTILNSFDLNQKKIGIESLLFEDLYGKLNLGKQSKENSSGISETNNTFWEINANKLDLNNINFIYNNNNFVSSKGLDTNHLDFKKTNLTIENFIYTPSKISGKITRLNGSEKSGLLIKDLTTDFEYTDKNTSLKNLTFITPVTHLTDENVAISYPSISSVSTNPEKMYVNAQFKNSKIGFKDILLIVPDLVDQIPFKSYPNSILNLSAQIKGKLDNLFIKEFNSSGLGFTKINMEGTIKGLPKIETSIFNLKINHFESSSQDIKQFVPQGTLPQSITLPEKFSLKGNFIGSINDFKTHLDLESSFGKATADATYDQTKKENEKYYLKATLKAFEIGKLIQNETIGKVTTHATLEGNSLNPKTANAKANLEIVSAYYNRYNYSDLIVTGNIKNGKFDVISKSKNPNLRFDLTSTGDFDNKYPKAKLDLKIDFIDLNKLNLHAGALKMKGNISGDFETLDINHLNGTLKATQFLVALENEQFPLDTIALKSVATATQDSLILKSQFINVNLNGNYQLANLSESLSSSLAHYLDSKRESKQPKESQQIQFDIYIKEEEILKKIVPDLEEMSAITIKGAYNSTKDSIVIKGNIPNLKYAGNELIAANFSLDKQNDALIYDVQLEKIQNNNLIVPKTKFFGTIENNSINYQLQLVDPKDVEKYHISGKYSIADDKSQLIINPEKLILNYKNWSLDDQNQIQIDNTGINIKDFILNNGSSTLTIQSENTNSTAPIRIEMKDFELESLTNIIHSDYEFGGTINGTTTLETHSKNPFFISDLEIDNLTLKQDTIGKIALKVDNKIANTFTANLLLTGNDNQVEINGDYETSLGMLNLNVNLEKLQMQSIEPFTYGNLKESEGFLNGKLILSGKATNPQIEGALKFNNVGFNVSTLNSKFKLINDAIDFRNNLIVFKTFRFKDENDNDLEINGTINSTNYANLGFDLNVIASNFRAVNSEAKDSDLFYGELYLDNNLNIKGDFESPIIDGNIKINKDTKFTIVLPQEDPSIVDREGIVEFIDQDQPVLVTVKDPMKEITETEIKGINASVNIEIDKEAEISIIIDKANGDFLKLKGEAELNGGIDPSGKTTLTGKYEFTDGSYEMNFNLIKRKFDIKSGSYILWTGEPTTANVNVTAIYKSDVAPIDLVIDQLGEVASNIKNTYKQKIPIETQLKMTGELMKPEINFDIVLPEGNNNVSTEVINTTEAKLEQIRQDEDAMNKQVFAILLLNRFIGENPFQSESGGISAGYLAKQSASRILSEQLNQIASDLVNGFQIDFDLEATEQYTTGEKQDRTDLNVAVSKELLNDRLKISVGSSFGIEGTPNKNEQANTIAGDLSAEYLLTKDGRYKLKAYRKNNYQVALQGQVVETGVAFIITMNYDKFKELFQKNKDKKQ